MVMLVTARFFTDRTLPLQPGAHSFIRHESHVDYGSANLFPSAKIEGALQRGAATLHSNMSSALLVLVRSGIFRSSRAMHFMTDHCARLFDQAGNDLERM